MIATWLSRRRAARTATSKRLVGKIRAAIERDILPHLHALGFIISPFLPAEKPGLIWDGSNRLWETELARLTGDVVDTLWIAVHPDHRRFSQIFISFNRLRLARPPSALQPNQYPLIAHQGVLSRAHIANSIDIRDLPRRIFPKPCTPSLRLRPNTPFDRQWPALRASMMAALHDLSPFQREWEDTNSMPIILAPDGTCQ